MKALALSAQGIRAGADEIAQAADDLSRRTEKQAASLEETAAALDQITATVRKTADGATEASDVVLAAKTDAEQSGAVVRDAVSAMSEIETLGAADQPDHRRDRRDRLPDQPAGAERRGRGGAGRRRRPRLRRRRQRSARARPALGRRRQGDQGADLDLVQPGGPRRAAGRREPATALDRIVAKVGEINQLVASIAASAKEQALGLHEVNSAINQMDHVTQQNAAMVQESTAASFALASEAQQLTVLIQGFEIGEALAPAPPRVVHEMPAASAAQGRRRWRPRRRAQDGWEEF